MPTPFMHLQMAHEMVENERLNGRFRTFLLANFPAFYFGSIAPDTQNITEGRIKRSATHFYQLPPLPEERGDDLLTVHPSLDEGSLSARKCAFLAGYIAHLQIDIVWNRHVLQPYFIFNDAWGDIGRRERFMRHNLLLTYLDQEAEATLPATVVDNLAHIASDHWLPFIPDDDLNNWRENIRQQLLPHADSRTVAIFAERLGLTVEEFEGRLSDETWLFEQVFAFAPLANVQTMLQKGMEEAVHLMNQYLSNRL